MGKITFEHAGCNGWAIYDRRYIEADEAHNIHVAECKITTNQNGQERICPNKETICGERLKDSSSGRSNIYHSKDATKIRLKLAELQNEGIEVCGTCVSHFYADPKA